MRKSDFAFHVAKIQELRLLGETLWNGEDGLARLELVRGNQEVRTGSRAAMSEPQTFGPGRDSDAASFVDDDTDRLAFVVLLRSDSMNFLLIVIQNERNLSV